MKGAADIGGAAVLWNYGEASARVTNKEEGGLPEAAGTSVMTSELRRMLVSNSL